MLTTLRCCCCARGCVYCVIHVQCLPGYLPVFASTSRRPFSVCGSLGYRPFSVYRYRLLDYRPFSVFRSLGHRPFSVRGSLGHYSFPVFASTSPFSVCGSLGRRPFSAWHAAGVLSQTTRRCQHAGRWAVTIKGDARAAVCGERTGALGASGQPCTARAHVDTMYVWVCALWVKDPPPSLPLG